MVDISHVSDKTFYDALEVSRAPLIASHSSVRALSAHARNMNDEMIKALAARGGVIQINYEVTYLSEEFRKAYDAEIGAVSDNDAKLLKECHGDDVCAQEAGKRQIVDAQAAGRLPHVSWEKIIEHIVHVVDLVGADHVGLGSDFDGANMPEGMDDCSYLPRITEALVRHGYSDADIRKILGGNMLRVMAAAERVAGKTQNVASR
jgi:membrane dipeptidase